MKFGQYLSQHLFGPWRNEYIDYDRLKQFLKQKQTQSRGWTHVEETYFTESLLTAEFNKVHSFIDSKMHQRNKENVSNLIDFIKLNAVGFQKILKKHDKWTGISLRSSKKFSDMNHHFERLVSQISQQERITKYWIHYDHLNEMRAILLFYLPIIQQDSLLNTVYFDNHNFDYYSQFVERKKGAMMLRARCFGPLVAASNVSLERKIYHDFWSSATKEQLDLNYYQANRLIQTGEYHGSNSLLATSIHGSVKKNNLSSVLYCSRRRSVYGQGSFRIMLDTDIVFMKEGSTLGAKENHCFPYAVLETTSIPEWLLRNPSLYQVSHFSTYLYGISHFFKQKLPMLPFWLGEVNTDIRKRQSYLTDATTDYMTAVSQQPTSQCIVIEPPLTPDYFRINKKLSDHNTTESQVKLFQSNIKDSSFFSDGLVAKTKDTPQIKNDEISMMKWLHAKLTNNKLVLCPPESEGYKKKRIEPKIFFSNERTFINWLQFSALLLTVSLGLINFGDQVSRASGAFFIIIAIFLALYAQLRFQYRSWQIRYKSNSRFDDIYGPAILCFVLVIALFVNLGLRINQPLPTHPSPFGYNNTLNNSNSTTPIMHGIDQNEVSKNHRLPNGTKVDSHGNIKPKKKDEGEDEDED